ncbi:hypothetical protein BH10ACI4_BH10ACI4_25070 [soil metagenome]
MWDSIKSWFNTKQSSQVSLVETLSRQNAALTEHLSEALQASQELNRRQADTLDRIVQSRFDVPVFDKATAQPTPYYSLPEGMLSDMLSIPDDGDFLAASQELNE